MNSRLATIPLTLTAVFMWSLAGLATPPSVPLEPSHYNNRYTNLPHGKELKVVLKYITAYLQRKNAVRIRNAPDPSSRDRVRDEINQKVSGVKDSYIAFTGQRTGYNVSVIGSEFAHKTSESMAVVAVGNSHDYYFFMRGHLWKLVATHVESTPFPKLLNALTKKYGAPSTITYKDPKTKKDAISATWKNDEYVLTARTKPTFGAITISWARRTVFDKLNELRGGVLPPGAPKKSRLDPSIEDVMRD